VSGDCSQGQTANPASACGTRRRNAASPMTRPPTSLGRPLLAWLRLGSRNVCKSGCKSGCCADPNRSSCRCGFGPWLPQPPSRRPIGRSERRLPVTRVLPATSSDRRVDFVDGDQPLDRRIALRAFRMTRSARPSRTMARRRWRLRWRGTPGRRWLRDPRIVERIA